MYVWYLFPRPRNQASTSASTRSDAGAVAPPLDHMLFDFDHKDIAIGGRRVTPPKLQGVSGGGIFHISRSTFQGPLVAIATKNRRNSRLIVGTRLKHFLRAARQLRATAPPEAFE